MKVIIHRGTNQIGGCVTEIATQTARIFIDVGKPLTDESFTKLKVKGLNQGAPNCDGVLLPIIMVTM